MFSFFRERRWQFLIAISEFVYMGVEMVASRIMSPNFGTTLDIWSVIIGTILASSAIGNWLAGFVGDDTDKRSVWIVCCLGICSLWLSCLNPLFFCMMNTGIFGNTYGVVQALIVCVTLFMIPGICFGALSPLVLGQYAAERGLETASAGSGLYAAMTLGGLAGTFASGLWLIPALGSINFVFLASFVCILLTVCSVFMLGFGKQPKFVLLSFSPAIVLAVMFVISLQPTGSGGLDEWFDTQYGRVHVVDSHYDSKPSRNLEISGGFESAMYLDDETHAKPVFTYVSKSDKLFDTFVNDGDKALCLGGGAYSIPKWLALNNAADVYVIEIDPGVTNVARKYFYLDDVSNVSKHGIENHQGDARVVMPKLESGVYSLVYNDTFAGNEPAATLSTIEAARDVKARLKPGGLYISNVIGMLGDIDNQFLGWEIRTLKEAFGNVHLISCYENYEANSYVALNWLVVATDDMDWTVPEGFIDVPISNVGGNVLTDDNCPVETLTARLHMMITDKK